MAIEKIDEELCDGCGICVDSCSADVIRLGYKSKPWKQNSWVAQIRYPYDCHSCCLCERDCPKGAIKASFLIEIPPDCYPYRLTAKDG